MSKYRQEPMGPVSLSDHYDVFKGLEEDLHEHLSKLDHEYFPIGIRVEYDDAESPNEPGDMPYKVDFGYLGPLEMAMKCTEPERQLEDNELETAFGNAPISPALLDEWLEKTKSKLENAAGGKELRVGISVVLTGSPTLGYSVNCPCPNRKKQYCYYDYRTKQIRCYCTTRGC